MTIGTLIGSLLVGPFSSSFGRKAGLWAASLLNFVATAIMLGTTNLGALYFARLLLGTPLREIYQASCCLHTKQAYPWAGSSPSRSSTSTKWPPRISEA